jgi:hypothetical protein
VPRWNATSTPNQLIKGVIRIFFYCCFRNWSINQCARMSFTSTWIHRFLRPTNDGTNKTRTSRHPLLLRIFLFTPYISPSSLAVLASFLPFKFWFAACFACIYIFLKQLKWENNPIYETTSIYSSIDTPERRALYFDVVKSESNFWACGHAPLHQTRQNTK